MGEQFICIGKAPVVWRSFKEKSVTLSTMEIEFVSLVEVEKEIRWLQNVLKECSDHKIFSYSTKPLLLVNNQATIEFIKSPIENFRTKHINVKYLFARELFYDGAFSVKYVKSKNNMPDVFTKPLAQIMLRNFQHCCSNRRKKFPDFSLTILRKIFVLPHKDIRHIEGSIKILLLENAKMFQMQMTLIKI